MTANPQLSRSVGPANPSVVHPPPTAPESRSATGFRYVAAALRLSIGWVFLWAFLDKLLALGFATGRNSETGVVDRLGDAAWINGGSPTEGFLTFGTSGPFAGFYQSFAGAGWADWLFMAGLAGIGIALTAGIATRIAATSGVLMLVVMWSAAVPPANNPFMDDHLIYALALVALALVGAGKTLGLGTRWETIPVVQQYGILK